jgi:acyl carrier protein
MTIDSKVLNAIKIASEKNDEEIINATSWAELGFDSLQTVELIMQIEDLFDINIEDEDAETLKNYNDLLAFIKGKTQ